jgi:hypothetical protein
MFFTVGFIIESSVLVCLLVFYCIKKRKEIHQRWVEYDHIRFMSAETKLIEIAKWIEGEHTHRDPGATEQEKNAFMEKWIVDHATGVRNAWNDSKCRTCCKDCFYNMKKECSNFLENESVILWQNGKQQKRGNVRFVEVLKLNKQRNVQAVDNR